jgi:hypothetical protein
MSVPPGAKTPMQNSTLLILAGEGCGGVMHAALRHAQSKSKRLTVLQILSSDLYHYGHQDLVATRPSKRQFLLYIREEVLERGKSQIRTLEEAARETGVYLEISTVESEDAYSTCLSEVIKGYDVVFVPKQETKRFPLFKGTLAAYLRKKTRGEVLSL